MPKADGSIIIDTEINADGMKAGSKDIEATLRRMASSVENLGTSAKSALNKQIDSFEKLNREYEAQEKKVESLREKVSVYKNEKIPTTEYREIQDQISKAEQELNKLVASQERFVSTGGKTSSTVYQKYQHDIDQLLNTIKYAKVELKDLEETGKAFTIGNESKQAAADMEKLAAAERKLADMNNRLNTSYSSIKSKINDYNSYLSKNQSSTKNASSQTSKFSKSLKSTANSAKAAQIGIARMLGMSILYSFTFQAISAAINAIKEGFENLSQFSGSTNNSISMLWSSLERLKNSLATAFAPILDIVAPILSRFIDMLSTAASYVSMFFAFLSGKNTYTRAIAVQKDYAASLKDTADGAKDAKEEMEGYLSPLDEINKYQKKDSSSKDKGSGGKGENDGPFFEEVPIDNQFSNLLDTILDKLKEIRDIFMSGFWDGLGDYKPLIEELKKDLKSIGAIAKEIFTDKYVKASAKKFAESFIYNVGKIAGSFAKIGLTIGVNIVGGIESYLRENSERIKRYLISIFDVGSEIFDIVGDFSADVADIISDSFSSQTAQDLTGNIIGLFSDAFFAVGELALKSGRDIADAITSPISDNKDKIKTALEETIAPIEKFTQTIEDFLQRLIDKINELYDGHIKPFIDSIKNGLSEIVGAFLDSYNQYIAPILDQWAAKFDEVMDGPIGEAFDKIIDGIGEIIDSIKFLWEDILVPFITWIIENIIPVLAPIIEYLGGAIIDLLGVIGTVVSGIIDILGGLTEFILGVFSGDWERAFDGLKKVGEGFLSAINSIFDFIQKYVIEPFDKFVKEIFVTDWTESFGILGDILNSFSNTIKDIWDAIKEVFNGVVDFINGVFSGNWKRAWEGIKEIFKGVFDGLAVVIKTPLNAIITLINSMITGVNTLIGGINKLPNVDIPKIGKIPYLAKGAVIPPNKEFMAVLGDQKHGNNIEAPEGLIRRIVREESKGGLNGKIEVPVYLDRYIIAKAVIEGAKVLQMQSGRNPFDLA